NLSFVWEGPLAYDLNRFSKDEEVAPSRSGSGRRPLLAPGAKPVVPPGWAAPGQFKNNEEQAEAIIAWYRDHLPPDPDTTNASRKRDMQGETTTQWHSQVVDVSGGSSLEGTADSTRDLAVEEHGEEDPGPPPQFKTIDLINQGDPLLHAAMGVVTDSSGQTT